MDGMNENGGDPQRGMTSKLLPGSGKWHLGIPTVLGLCMNRLRFRVRVREPFGWYMSIVHVVEGLLRRGVHQLKRDFGIGAYGSRVLGLSLVRRASRAPGAAGRTVVFTLIHGFHQL